MLRPQNRTKILGSGSAFPTQVVTNSDLAQKVDTSDEWVVSRTGIKERRISNLNKAEHNSDLALRASLEALETSGLKATDIDMILVATVSPDHIMPNTACLLQHKLGAGRAAALDISAACSGFVYGLTLADSLIKTHQFRHILLVGSEVLSPLVNWDDRNTCVLFGDGAGAVVLGATPEGDASQFYSHHLYADGSLKEHFIVPAGGTALPLTPAVLHEKLHTMKMKGKEIFKEATRMLSDCTIEAIESNGFHLNDVDWLVPHQANLRIIEAVAKRLEFPLEKVIINVDRYGNTSAATVPTAFHEAVMQGRIKRGQLICFTVFGAGLTYGSTLLRY